MNGSQINGIRHRAYRDILYPRVFPRVDGWSTDPQVFGMSHIKAAHFLAVWMTFTLKEFYRLYIHEIFQLHGVPISIVLDRDPRFTACF